MRIAVIGAGPAGLTAAKQSICGGHEVVVFEKTGDVGGIWNPASGGAYDGVRMQSSRMSFPFSDFAPDSCDDFPTLPQMHGYLRAYAEHFGVLPAIRFRQEVTGVAKRASGWTVTAGPDQTTESFDAVLVAIGELWRSRMPGRLPDPGAGVRVLTAKDYQHAGQLRGRRVLVVGGGVSGADISSELVGTAASVDWSIRRRALFLPRDCGGIVNDGMLSYIGRLAVAELPYRQWLARLERLLPEYMAAYRASGLLPDAGFHHAVHVNDTIVPHVHAGNVRVRPAFERFAADGTVTFASGDTGRFDAVVLCLGYEAPDYSFIAGFRHEDLYEHHFYRHHPTLAVINTPVGAEAFGTACPYFEAVAGWVLAVLAQKVAQPDSGTMAEWCAWHMSLPHDWRHLDCWLETIRIGLCSGALPDPETSFTDYWNLVASIVSPANLRATGTATRPAPMDAMVDLAALRQRVLAALPARVRSQLLTDGQISADELAAADAVPAHRAIAPWLPYRERR